MLFANHSLLNCAYVGQLNCSKVGLGIQIFVLLKWAMSLDTNLTVHEVIPKRDYVRKEKQILSIQCNLNLSKAEWRHTSGWFLYVWWKIDWYKILYFIKHNESTVVSMVFKRTPAKFFLYGSNTRIKGKKSFDPACYPALYLSRECYILYRSTKLWMSIQLVAGPGTCRLMSGNVSFNEV